MKEPVYQGAQKLTLLGNAMAYELRSCLHKMADTACRHPRHYELAELLDAWDKAVHEFRGEVESRRR